MKTYVLFLAVPTSCFLGYAQSREAPYSNFGELILPRLVSAPFPHPKRAAGYSYGSKTFTFESSYRDSTVAIFVPKNYRQSDAVDLVIHFHGWYNNVDTTLERYRLIEQFSESGKNAILVVPEGPKNAPDSFGGKLEDPNGFRKFITEIMDTLLMLGNVKTRHIGSIILSGHSGGYHVISFILMRGGMSDHVKEVFLFDALYGQTEKFGYWIDHFGGKFIDLYTDSGGTKFESLNLMSDLDGWGIPYIAAEEKEPMQDVLKNQRLIFLHSGLEHDDVIHKHHAFREFLKASVLSDR